MSTAMPELQTERLIIRPFGLDDLEVSHRVLSDAWGIPLEARAGGFAGHERYIRWSAKAPEGLADLKQPPYGDRAVVLKETGALIGVAGLVPALGPFGQLPGFPANAGSRHFFPEVGLVWAIDPAHHRRGYATEAGKSLIEFAFGRMNLGRIIATTEYDNEASIGVMRKAGMRILRNPHAEPPWFQVVGVLERH